jgi:hypothetical protein
MHTPPSTLYHIDTACISQAEVSIYAHPSQYVISYRHSVYLTDSRSRAEPPPDSTARAPLDGSAASPSCSGIEQSIRPHPCQIATPAGISGLFCGRKVGTFSFSLSGSGSGSGSMAAKDTAEAARDTHRLCGASVWGLNVWAECVGGGPPLTHAVAQSWYRHRGEPLSVGLRHHRFLASRVFQLGFQLRIERKCHLGFWLGLGQGLWGER